MKLSTRYLLLLTTGLLLSLPAVRSDSQLAPTADPLADLQALQTGNDDLLKRQEATLKDLTDMTATANEVRIFSRRN